MNNKILYSFAIFTLLSVPITAQIRFNNELNKQDTLQASYKNSTKKPFFALKGTQLLVETDTVYLVNTLRNSYYQSLQDLKTMVETDNADVITLEIIKTYERALDSCQLYYKKLLENAEQTDARSNAFLNKTNETVESVKITLKAADDRLKDADKKLEDANTKLNDAKDLIRRSRMKTILQKILIGVAAALLGFAIGKSA